MFHELSSEAVPSHLRHDEERADAAGFARGIEQRIGTGLRTVCSEQRASPAPAAARHDCLLMGNDEIGLVSDELRIDAEYVASDRLGLSLRVVTRAELAARARNERLEQGQI